MYTEKCLGNHIRRQQLLTQFFIAELNVNFEVDQEWGFSLGTRFINCVVFFLFKQEFKWHDIHAHLRTFTIFFVKWIVFFLFLRRCRVIIEYDSNCADRPKTSFQNKLAQVLCAVFFTICWTKIDYLHFRLRTRRVTCIKPFGQIRRESKHMHTRSKSTRNQRIIHRNERCSIH